MGDILVILEKNSQRFNQKQTKEKKTKIWTLKQFKIFFSKKMQLHLRNMNIFEEN